MPTLKKSSASSYRVRYTGDKDKHLLTNAIAFYFAIAGKNFQKKNKKFLPTPEVYFSFLHQHQHQSNSQDLIQESEMDVSFFSYLVGYNIQQYPYLGCIQIALYAVFLYTSVDILLEKSIESNEPLYEILESVWNHPTLLHNTQRCLRIVCKLEEYEKIQTIWNMVCTNKMIPLIEKQFTCSSLDAEIIASDIYASMQTFQSIHEHFDVSFIFPVSYILGKNGYTSYETLCRSFIRKYAL